MSSSADCIFTPNSSTASGMRATEGIGRRNSIVERVARSRNRLEPMAKPSTVPATTAIARPIAQLTMVSPTSRQNCRSRSIPAKRTSTSLAGGRNRGSMTPVRVTSSQMRSSPAIPASPRPTPPTAPGRCALRLPNAVVVMSVLAFSGAAGAVVRPCDYGSSASQSGSAGSEPYVTAAAASFFCAASLICTGHDGSTILASVSASEEV